MKYEAQNTDEVTTQELVPIVAQLCCSDWHTSLTSYGDCETTEVQNIENVTYTKTITYSLCNSLVMTWLHAAFSANSKREETGKQSFVQRRWHTRSRRIETGTQRFKNIKRSRFMEIDTKRSR